MEYLEILMRLGVAILAGGAIGLDRDLHGKPVGVRTLGIVSLGAAMLVIAGNNLSTTSGSDVSRVIQGLITGIGFLGAGVIVHQKDSAVTLGLTTAACIWFTSVIGIVCGLAHWRLLVIALPLIFLILALGGPIERAVHQWWDNRREG
jgi:putative Mg2+ transporter-C (MgtC) family protein